MEEWKEYKLAEVCTKITDGSHSSPKAQESGYPMFSVKDMLEYGFDYSKCKYISQEDYVILKKNGCVPQKGDVLVAKDGSYLKQIFVCKETKEEAILSSIAIFRPNSLVDSFFLSYLLKSPQVYNYIANNCVSGSALPRIVLKDFKEVNLPIPSIEIQKSIVSILKSFDDKIEVNRRINDNLEQQAQALFKSWFVDFEPFKNGEFVDSELGMIPKGWRVGTLGDICVTNRRAYKGNFAHEIEYIDTGSVTNNVIDPPQILNPAKDKIPSRARRAVTEGDIIYSSVRPNQRHYALLFNPSFNTVVSTGFVVITANWSGYRYYIYQYLIQDEIVDKLQAIAEQSVSTFPSLNATDITNLKIVIPPNEVVGDFAIICCYFIEQIEKNQQESRRLATLRDTLLPKLMSGELKVNEVEI